MIPDCERIVSDYLRDHDAVVDTGARIVAHTPKEENRDEPWVRVTQLDAEDRSKPADHLIEFYVQFDCYAGKEDGQPEAIRVMRAVRQALFELDDLNHQDHDAVVTGAQVTGGRRGLADEFAPARSVYYLSATVWAHTTGEES